jgi:predicted nucleotidyltransferase component of viral defense system
MNVFDQMLSRYVIGNAEDKRNATCEVMQEIVLSGLNRGGFFDKAAFYGGTCLRIFQGMERFSEDMDFSLTAKDPYFRFEAYFPNIVDEFKSLGKDVVITQKDKKSFGRIDSAFLKEDTSVYNIAFQTEKDVKIKMEVDIDPPLGFVTEQKLMLHPSSFYVKCFALPDLFAGKMHALLFRNWKTRVKGRDWYDFEWYVRHDVPLDFQHLKERTKQFDGIDISKDELLDKLKERLSSTDIGIVKQDVLPFIKNKDELDIWSNDYFLQLASKIRFL